MKFLRSTQYMQINKHLFLAYWLLSINYNDLFFKETANKNILKIEHFLVVLVIKNLEKSYL